MINEDFGLNVEGKDKVTLLRELYDYLVDIHASGKRALIIIDEAQNLTTEVLEEIRLLSNLEADTLKLLQIILVGQPELLDMITSPELRQLRQRISIHCHLQPLTREETESYVYHRLETAGNRDAVVWHEGAFDMLFHYSGGIPRLINLFCDFALLCAFAEESRELSLDLLREVIGDIAWEQEGKIATDVRLRELRTRTGDCSSLSERVAALETAVDGYTSILRYLNDHEQRMYRVQQESNERTEKLLEQINEHLGQLLETRKASL
jgi:hypothetical protein